MFLFFFNDTATTEIYTLSLHDALPISFAHQQDFTEQTFGNQHDFSGQNFGGQVFGFGGQQSFNSQPRSEEHTSELQSHLNLVCRLLLEKKKTYTKPRILNDHIDTFRLY